MTETHELDSRLVVTREERGGGKIKVKIEFKNNKLIN